MSLTRLIHRSCIGLSGAGAPTTEQASITSISLMLVASRKWIDFRRLS
jgi:hypothetical protein